MSHTYGKPILETVHGRSAEGPNTAEESSSLITEKTNHLTETSSDAVQGSFEVVERVDHVDGGLQVVQGGWVSSGVKMKHSLNV